jgi:hypothetical protein
MKCSRCNGCTHEVWIKGVCYLYCDFCRKYYQVINAQLVDVTKDVNLKLNN